MNELIRRRISVLERLHDRITGCEITLDAPQKRKVSGRVFRAHLSLHIPGPDFSIAREVAQGTARDDLLLAVNRAFSGAEKHLKRQKKKMSAVETKRHAPVLHGRVSLIEPELGYGYVNADDGREVYFQRDSFASDVWDQLEKGTRLRFREQDGEKGPFAVGASLAE